VARLTLPAPGLPIWIAEGASSALFTSAVEMEKHDGTHLEVNITKRPPEQLQNPQQLGKARYQGATALARAIHEMLT